MMDLFFKETINSDINIKINIRSPPLLTAELDLPRAVVYSQ